MNTNNQRTVQQLLDREWIVAVEEEIAANPMGIAFSVEPAILGQFDSESGLPCDPHGRGYTKSQDIDAYVQAWNDTNALLEETREYMDYLLDVEWIRSGC
jgi:hypothetical protein